MRERIKNAWAWTGADRSLIVIVQFNITPEGEIRNVRTIQSSGDTSYDASCRARGTRRQSTGAGSREVSRRFCHRRADLPGQRSGVLMRIVALVAAAVVLGLAAVPPVPAQVRSTIVGPGVNRYPIAVAPLKQIVGGAGDAFTKALSRDLELSGLFRVLPRDAYIENAQTAGVTAEAINFENWSVIGALALVKGTAERQGNDLTIEARLFDAGQRRQSRSAAASAAWSATSGAWPTASPTR